MRVISAKTLTLFGSISTLLLFNACGIVTGFSLPGVENTAKKCIRGAETGGGESCENPTTGGSVSGGVNSGGNNNGGNNDGGNNSSSSSSSSTGTMSTTTTTGPVGGGCVDPSALANVPSSFDYTANGTLNLAETVCTASIPASEIPSNLTMMQIKDSNGHTIGSDLNAVDNCNDVPHTISVTATVTPSVPNQYVYLQLSGMTPQPKKIKITCVDSGCPVAISGTYNGPGATSVSGTWSSTSCRKTLDITNAVDAKASSGVELDPNGVCTTGSTTATFSLANYSGTPFHVQTLDSVPAELNSFTVSCPTYCSNTIMQHTDTGTPQNIPETETGFCNKDFNTMGGMITYRLSPGLNESLMNCTGAPNTFSVKVALGETYSVMQTSSMMGSSVTTYTCVAGGGP